MWGRVKFLFSFIVLAVLCLAVAGLLAKSLGYFQAAGRPISYTVEKGENFAGIARKLQVQGIIHNERALRWYLNFFATKKPLQRGEFSLYTNMPVPELVKVLTEGKPIEHKFTIPEGQNIFQIAEDLEAKGFASKADFLSAARSPELIQLIPRLSFIEPKPKSIEGYVYPDTYLLQKVYSAKEIAQIMLRRFREVYDGVEKELLNNYLEREFRFTPHQIINLASIVEKETGASSERPLVASVFVNRLRKRMRLQTDPTIIYGIYLERGSWDGNIRRRDLGGPRAIPGMDTARSTRLRRRPPGPISNPGISAIQAVLHPAESQYLYFVSKGDGTHVFSKDYESHAKAVRDSIRPGAKAGKSWRDLSPEQRVK